MRQEDGGPMGFDLIQAHIDNGSFKCGGLGGHITFLRRMERIEYLVKYTLFCNHWVLAFYHNHAHITK